MSSPTKNAHETFIAGRFGHKEGWVPAGGSPPDGALFCWPRTSARWRIAHETA